MTQQLAIVFFGQAKTYTKEQHEKFTEFVLPSFEDYNIHYFHVTTRRLSFENPRNFGEGRVECHADSLQMYINFHNQWFDGLEDENSLINQKIRSLTKELLTYGKPWGKYSTQSLINSLRQIYSLEFFYKRFINVHHYDLFLLVRSDLFFTNPLGKLNRTFESSRHNDVFVPTNAWMRGGCNDRLMMTRSSYSLGSYCSRFSKILNQPEFYSAEQYCLKHLYRNEIHVKQIPEFEQKLLRGNGKLTNYLGQIENARIPNSDNTG
jgi:hypothetical protein